MACLIAEPIQGVGGFTMPPDGLFGEYKKVLDERGILFISDEVQTGWGRTGEHFWGFGAHGITPDMITFAKGLGNGFAIGGVIARGDLMDGLPGNGISTFGGNPLSTTAASATLDYLLDHDLQRNAATLGSMIIGGLAEAAAPLAAVGGVRGKGLMFAVNLVDPRTGAPSPALATRVLEETRERGLLIGKGGLYGHALRMAPPMTLTEADAKEGMGILIDALRAVDAEAGDNEARHSLDRRQAMGRRRRPPRRHLRPRHRRGHRPRGLRLHRRGRRRGRRRRQGLPRLAGDLDRQDGPRSCSRSASWSATTSRSSPS